MPKLDGSSHGQVSLITQGNLSPADIDSMEAFSPADLAAFGHLPSVHTLNDEWDGCGCCGWCEVVVECSCGWEHTSGGTMTRGAVERQIDGYPYTEWLDHAREHIKVPDLAVPKWLCA